MSDIPKFLSHIHKFSRSAAFKQSREIIEHARNEGDWTDEKAHDVARHVLDFNAMLTAAVELIIRLPHGSECHHVNGTVKCFCGKSQFLARVEETK